MDKELDLLEQLIVLYKNKFKILFAVILVTGLTALYVLKLPNVYTAKAVFLPPKQSASAISGIASQLSSLPLLTGGLDLAGEIDPFDVLLAHLRKEENLWKAIEKFDFRKRYGLETAPKIDVEKSYLVNLEIERVEATGLVNLRFTDQSPELTRDVVNFNLDLLQAISRENVTTTNRKKKEFIEKRLQEVKQELEASENALMEFQMKHGILAIESQAGATVRAVSELHTEILVNQVKLDVQKKLGVSDNHPELKRLVLEIKTLNDKLLAVQNGQTVMNFDPEIGEVNQPLTYIPLDRLPQVRVEIERLSRTKLVAQEVFKVLSQEYEMAKLDASKDQEVIEIIERARVPEKKSGPSRTRACALALVLSTFVFCFLVLLWNSIKPKVVQLNS